jgi:hypothetical protein
MLPHLIAEIFANKVAIIIGLIKLTSKRGRQSDKEVLIAPWHDRDRI